MIDHDTILANRATVEALMEDTTCPHQGTHSYFIAKVDQGTIPIDLPTILQCLRLAQTQGALPPLPEDWWNKIAMDHNMTWITI